MTGRSTAPHSPALCCSAFRAAHCSVSAGVPCGGRATRHTPQRAAHLRRSSKQGCKPGGSVQVRWAEPTAPPPRAVAMLRMAGGWDPAGAAVGGPLPAVAKPPFFGGGGPHTLPPRSRGCAAPHSGMWRAASLVRLPVWVAVLRSLFRHFACCRAAALRSPASGGAPRPRCRGSGGAVAGPLPFPPALSVGPCAPLCGSVAAPCRPCAVLPLRALRAPCSVALASLGVAVALRDGLPGPPLVAPAGFGPGASAPGGCGGGAAALVAFAPGLFLVLAGCARCAFLRRGFSPAPLPSPPPPLGAPGKRVALLGGLRAPVPLCGPAPPGLPSSRAPSHCSGAGKGQAGRSERCALRPPLPLPLRFFWHKALTKANTCATLVVRGPLGRFGAPPARVSDSG